MNPVPYPLLAGPADPARVRRCRSRRIRFGWWPALLAAVSCGPLDRFVAPGKGGAPRFSPQHLKLFQPGYSPRFSVPLDQPIWRSAAAADHMRPEDPVVGFVLNGNSWAIPWWILKNHHAANLTLAGQPLLVTLCERCSSAAAFDPRVRGRRLTFRIVGMYNGTHILGDDQSGTLWTPFVGEAVSGRLVGIRLRRLPAYQAHWKDWRAWHPETLVAFGAERLRGGHSSVDRPGLSFIDREMRETLVRWDDRLPASDLVLGVRVGRHARAYALEDLGRSGGVLQDSLGGEPIVILHRRGTLLAAAFRRRLDNQPLAFELRGRLFVDRQSGSAWGLDGVAGSGPLAGRRLAYVPSGVEEWYQWAAANPDTEIYRARPLQGGGKP